MQIIVIGCGKVGARFAQVLSEDGHDVVIVDNDSRSFKALDPDFDGITITGVPIDQDVLKKAGIETADALAAVTPDDNVNIMVCQVAKEIFKIPKVVARIYDPARENIFQHFGLQTICPTQITVEVIKSMVVGEPKTSLHTIANTVLTYNYVKAQNTYFGKKLNSVKLKENSFVFGIIQNGSFYFANEDITINQGDTLVIAQKGR
ncbi:potassium channel family protein [Acetivibrio cellulolyticus]|uniref:potassium channel family protein n=1 Tax=Acetivibrio cellulolyticus TaxID=35830 RepID=UPI0001E2D0AA|nr:TrkA family potassium uptake protein [Acetivibrio cellulolyticus]